MAVVAFVRSDPGVVAGPAGVPPCADFREAETWLRLYGRAMRFCFILVLALWVTVQIGCVLSLFLHFRSGIVVGTIDGTVAFQFWPLMDYFAPDHALAHQFVRHIFPVSVTIAYSVILIAASAPFCASLFSLAELFNLYASGTVFARRNAVVMRRAGHCIMATGYSPLLLGPAAHAIGVLKPVTGVTDAMIAFVLLGLMLLAIAHVMRIGESIQQDQEAIL